MVSSVQNDVILLLKLFAVYSQEECSHIMLYLILFSGATVYMVCRSKERGEAALSKIQSTTGNPNVHLEVYRMKLLFLHAIHLTVIDILCN